MDVDSLFFTIFGQVPFYRIQVGDHFCIEHRPFNYSDIMQKTVESKDEHGDLYVGADMNYLIIPRTLVTLVEPLER